MNRQTADQLADFCIRQRQAFNLGDWQGRDPAEARNLGLVAKYLSMTSWYGYEDELEQVAARNLPGEQNDLGQVRELLLMDLDLRYFSAKLRCAIADSQARQRRRA